MSGRGSGLSLLQRAGIASLSVGLLNLNKIAGSSLSLTAGETARGTAQRNQPYSCGIIEKLRTTMESLRNFRFACTPASTRPKSFS